MHDDPWSFAASDPSDAGGDDPEGAFAHAPHTDVPNLSHQPDGTHGIAPDPPISSDPVTITEVHVGNFAIVETAPVPDAGHAADPGHHDLLSLAKDSGWLEPTSPPMLAIGGLFTGLVGARLKRLKDARTDDLGEHLARGERVIAGVDADELDRTQRGDRLSGLNRIPGQGVERPVEILSVDEDVLLDVGDGQAPRRVARDSFEAAWQRTGRSAFASPRDDSGSQER